MPTQTGYRRGFAERFLLIYAIATGILLGTSALAHDDVETEGFIQAINDSSLTVNDLTFLVDEGTEIEDEDGDDIFLYQLRVGDYVEIKADVLDDSSYLATEIEVEEPDDEIEVEGFITALGDYSLTVNGVDFLVTEETEIEGDDSDDLTFNDLSVGDFVEVEGYVDDAGNNIAVEIEVEDGDDDAGEDIELTGAIEALSDSAVTVAGIAFSIDQSTIIEDDDDNIIGFETLQLGMIVEIHAVLNGDAGYLATRIEVEDFFQDEIELQAHIEDIGSDFIVVLSITFQVDENTLVVDDNNMPIDFSLLQIGDLVEIRGEVQPDQSILATRIKLEDENDDEIELSGLIDHIGDNFLIVDSTQFEVNGNTLVLDHANNPITFADLEIGMVVEVRATIQPDGSFLATRIKIEDSPGFSITDGAVLEISLENVVVDGPAYQLGENTIILDEGFQPISASDILVGDEVRLWFDQDTGGDPLALQVRITLRAATGIAGQGDGLAKGFSLMQNYPNPFNPETTISFELTAPQAVELDIFNVNGQRVLTLVSGVRTAGVHQVIWDAKDSFGRELATGVYYYRLMLDQQQVDTRKMIFLK